METNPDRPIEELLSFREDTFDKHLELGRISLCLLDEYKDLAALASTSNVVAEYLPIFSMSLLDKAGSFGAIETAMVEELQTM